MENKMVKVPFDLEMAKKITSGEIQGRVITRLGYKARIVCFDIKNDDYHLIALVEEYEDGGEEYYTYNDDGSFVLGEIRDQDLMIEIPEYLTFKDGDIITCGWEKNGEFCKWISIFHNLNCEGCIDYNEYVSYCINASKEEWFDLSFDGYADSATWARKSTDDEVKLLINVLDKSEDPRSKEIIKKFFNIGKEGTNQEWITGQLPEEGEEVVALVDTEYGLQLHIVRFKGDYNVTEGKFTFGFYSVIAYNKIPSYEKFKK